MKRDSEDRGQLKRGKEVTFGHPAKSILKKPEATKTFGGYSSEGSNKNKENGELTCYRCGNVGHIRSNCRLPDDDHPKVVARKSAKSIGKIRRLQEGVDSEEGEEMSDNYSVDQSESESE